MAAMVDVLGNQQQGLTSRADLLRARFSDTIMKAKIWYHTKDETNESLRKLKEKKLMEKMRMQQQVKNRAAAVIAARKCREEKLKRQRQREAARRALEEVEKNVVVDDWYKTYNDFLLLIDSK